LSIQAQNNLATGISLVNPVPIKDLVAKGTGTGISDADPGPPKKLVAIGISVAQVCLKSLPIASVADPNLNWNPKESETFCRIRIQIKIGFGFGYGFAQY
jgi:hypothetical protein